MSSVQNTEVCPTCGEEYWYDLDLRSCEYTKISQCHCDRIKKDMEDFLKEKGLWEEFKKFHIEREREYREERGGELEDPERLFE